MFINRRDLLRATLATTAVAAGAGRFTVAESAISAASPYDGVFSRLDQFVEQYMRAMRSPGMTLVLADRDGVQRVATYGFADVDLKLHVRPEQLFQIGSISKSFLAVCLMQLHDEGKLDLHRPVIDYLPWFRVDSSFAPITPHHLLTHTSGLPGISNVFPSDHSARHRAAHAPGQHYHYNNMAYSLLGHLAWTLDGRELPEVLRKRVLEPLGMRQTEPVLTLDMCERLVKSYSAFQNDRVFPRDGRLSEAPAIVLTTAAGCVASTARDMGAYIRMFASRGAWPEGRLLSKDAFSLLARPHIEAKDFGPTASYGYGLAVDKLEGHTILRHTGGMVSFMSSILVDIDAGVGAFASINAQQGYRPDPVVQFAVQLMRARREEKPSPEGPVFEPPTTIMNAADYEGIYTDPAGRSLEVCRDGNGLFLRHGNERIVLERSGDADRFITAHARFAYFPLIFVRSDANDARSAVTELAWGGEWYTNASYRGPRQFDVPESWGSYVGHYRNENPWIGSLRIVLRKGQLWLDGTIPLEPQGDRFYLRDTPHNPEWIVFGEIINGQCMRLKLSGADLWRVATA